MYAPNLNIFSNQRVLGSGFVLIFTLPGQRAVSRAAALTFFLKKLTISSFFQFLTLTS